MLSVMIITKNEAKNIERCLRSVAFADEIVVLDSGSVDNTVALAKQFTENVFETDWPGYGKQKQRALDHCKGDWILNLDADECVSAELQSVILASLKEDNQDAYRIPVIMHFYGKPLPHCSSPTRHARLFKRQGARFSDDIVHEKIILPAGSRVGQLKAPILHQSFQDISHVLSKINRYSSYSAKIRLDNNKRGNLFITFVKSMWMFTRCYILQRGFLDGKSGLLFAIFNAQGTFYRGIKQLYPDADKDCLPD
ncbi:glycosyltransferase family 2 protein [Legionella sp. W05-934-2]|jgi:glycosyltransferase involved in cell wall biosynthesis|uniref:glycosyltransferase family 2 protein n=1 Tax=Legionella sp. W05-934-2 TaxID=1198649 RepID=UPI00346227F4